ncbi:MAG: hypoxanthine phosphoribosyltransferase [Bacilli bacterium]|nr:hypoxanthine phosphoribosyltransferase [Bacilli bacterium]
MEISKDQIKVLIKNDEVQKRISELAEGISNDYKGKDIEVICVLRGAAIFTVELCMQITENTRFNFIEISSYEGTESTGTIKINKDLTESIKGKDVLIVEDIIDTGRTLSYLRDYLLEKEPNSLKICTLVNKPARRETDLPIDYNGFTIEDKFIIGHGFDIDNNYRNLPNICYIEQKKKIKK